MYSQPKTAALRILQEKVASRCSATVEEYPDWPCRRGCDHCCRSLAQLPECSAAEWELVEAAVTQLPDGTRSGLRSRIEMLVANGSRAPLTCPFLNEDGCCSIYAARPIACRTYGFYVARDEGLYCRDIRERVDAGNFDGVIWGNHQSVDVALDALGPRIPLLERFRAQNIF